MLVYFTGDISGTIGGGKFEALVVEDARAAMRGKAAPVLKKYPLRENEAESFGAICGGEVTVLIEPQLPATELFLIGAGHCSRAIARLAQECGFFVTVVDDRADLLADFSDAHERVSETPEHFIAARQWQPDEVLVIASRNFEIDQNALGAALQQPPCGYVGMIGSKTKVQRVFKELASRGIAAERLRSVFAPLGLDIGADSPAEIAVSVMAEILQVMRGRRGGHLKMQSGADSAA